MVPGCSGLPCGSTNLSYCLVHGIRTSTWCSLSCVAISMDIGVCEFWVCSTAELFPLAHGVVTGVCGAAVMLAGVSVTKF